MTVDDLACDLYVAWCAGNSSSTPERSRERWAAMPDCGRRPFRDLAAVAIARVGRRCSLCEHEAAEEAEIRL